MLLKIEEAFEEDRKVLKISGRIRKEHLHELNRHEHLCSTGLAFDLGAVSLVDIEVVRFLEICESRGSAILQCPPFIREWINREREVRNRDEQP